MDYIAYEFKKDEIWNKAGWIYVVYTFLKGKQVSINGLRMKPPENSSIVYF
jgi:hypothetical protein